MEAVLELGGARFSSAVFGHGFRARSTRKNPYKKPIASVAHFSRCPFSEVLQQPPCVAHVACDVMPARWRHRHAPLSPSPRRHHRGHAATNATPPAWCGCRLHRAGGNNATPPSRHAPHHAIERAAAPWHTLHLCVVRAEAARWATHASPLRPPATSCPQPGEAVPPRRDHHHRVVVACNAAPPPWPCGHHRDALAMVRLSPPSRRRQQRDATITTRPAPRHRTGRCAMAHPAPVRRAGGGGPMGDACVAPTASCHIVPATWRSRASAARPSPPRRCRLQRGATTVAMRPLRCCRHHGAVVASTAPAAPRRGHHHNTHQCMPRPSHHGTRCTTARIAPSPHAPPMRGRGDACVAHVACEVTAQR